MKLYVPLLVLWIQLIAAKANAADESGQAFWSKFIANASQPVDGHFVVEIKSDTKTEQGPKVLRSTIEYWIRGNDMRFDVKDHEGRNLNSQVILKNKGQQVLSNDDRTNTSIVASQSDAGSPMAKNQRATWLYFQALLGRFPSSPLALYEESFQELKGLADASATAYATEGDVRIFKLSHPSGRSLEFRFNGSDLNPHDITVIRSGGGLAMRLKTDWRAFSSESKLPIAYSGLYEAYSASGAVRESCEWSHTFAEPPPFASDPFTWDAMGLGVGKKLIVSDSKDKKSTGGYWDGNTFSPTPIATNAPKRIPILLWLSVAGLALGLLLFVLKLRVSLKGSP